MCMCACSGGGGGGSVQSLGQWGHSRSEAVPTMHVKHVVLDVRCWSVVSLTLSWGVGEWGVHCTMCSFRYYSVWVGLKLIITIVTHWLLIYSV